MFLIPHQFVHAIIKYLWSLSPHLVELPWATFLSGAYLLRHGLFQSYRSFKVFQHELIHSHRYFEVYWLRHGLILGPWSPEGCTCCDVHIAMATEASEWSYPEVTVPLTWVHTGVLAWSVQQQGKSSSALAICQPWRMAIAIIKTSPGTRW